MALFAKPCLPLWREAPNSSSSCSSFLYYITCPLFAISPSWLTLFGVPRVHMNRQDAEDNCAVVALLGRPGTLERSDEC